MRKALLVSLLVWSACTPESPETLVVDFEVFEGTNLAFDISPDGETIVFDLLGQLWTLPIGGGEARPLTNAVRDTAEDVDPSFSPDGRWIVFEGDRPGGKGLWAISAEGGEPRRITPDGLYVDQSTDLQPTWGLDSRHVVYTLRDTVYRLDVETGLVSRIEIDSPEDVALTGLAAPSLSSDGRRLVLGTGAAVAFRWVVRADARLWQAPAEGGLARPLTAEGARAVAPAHAPDRDALAFFARDSTRRWQLWVQTTPGAEARKLTAHDDMAMRRVRWTPDGRELIYSADGRLWRIDAEGGSPTEIPFTARVRFARATHSPAGVRFLAPATEFPARGFYGLALSPDGGRIAMLALGKLWIWPVEGVPRAVGEVPDGAYHLSWSGDGEEVVFTTGNLFAADVETGALRQLTALPGEAGFPTWSPDGRHIAFIHEGWDLSEGWGHARVIPADGAVVEDLAQTIDLGRVPGSTWGRDQPAWGPDSRDILLYGTDGSGTTRATLATLGGAAREVRLPRSSSFVSRADSDSILYVNGVRLWKASFSRDSGFVGVPTPISEGPALYASTSTDGAILYVSSDGLRLLTPTGETRALGWPLRSITPPSPAPLVIRNARIIDGSGGPASGPHDLVIADGRIVRIAPAGTVAPDDRGTLLDAGGRYVIPGLIDLHQHIWSPHPPLEGGLYHGVTTVRDVGSSIAWSAAHRDLVDAGLRPGPRIVLGGSFFLSGDGLSKDAGLFVADSAQAARGIALVKGFGATYVKHYYDGWAGLKSIIDEAHRQGMPVTGHCASILPIVAAGMDGQEHTGSCVRDERGIYADYVRIKTAANIPIVSDAGFNLLFLQLLARPEDYEQRDIRPFLGFGTPTADTYDPANRERNRAMFELGTERQRTRTRQLYEAGATVAAGTDLWFPTAMHSAIEGMVAAGLSPAEAIAAATSVAAHVLGAESEIGTIEAGKLADLVILDADPLEDISNIRRVWQVILGGRIVDRGALIEFVRASPALASGPDYGY